MTKIKPGMSIFLSTGVAEPRTLLKSLKASESRNLQDLELIQLVSLGSALSFEERYSNKFRLKTFFSGWIASEAILAGKVDFIPARFSKIPQLIESGSIRIDVAFIQITPPNENGYSSLGLAVDVARKAMEKASIVVGEINKDVPMTLGDTFVHMDEFHYLVEGEEPPLYFPRFHVDETFDRIGANVASLIEDGSCIAFSVGMLFEALARHLARKKDLGIHTPLFTDPLMDLMKSGVVTNRKKGSFRGKSVAAYAVGTKELMRWLHNNPLVEFQGIDIVADPKRIGLNDRFIMVLPARKLDLTGGIALHSGKGNVVAGPSEAQEFFTGVNFSKKGHVIFALPSRNLNGESNILLSVEDYPNQLYIPESLDLVVTEYGTASLTGRTMRERALALIDIAHPDDREKLVRLAKENNIVFRHQSYLADSGRMYPAELSCTKTFKDGLTIRFRAIKPSDVEEMRRLFYRFSDKAVYYRYFSPIKTMPHAKMQEYVNIDYNQSMSMVGLAGEMDEERIIAEARYVRFTDRPKADVAFVVDEQYQGKGIASFMFDMLMGISRERGIKGFEADVLANNTAMIKVFEKSPYPVKSVLDSGIYEISIPFSDEVSDSTGLLVRE